MIVAIHQPEYLPHLGLLEKARHVDVLVWLDTVQFDRSSMQHRARIAGANGVFWLTIPFVHRFPQRIDEVAFAERRWQERHWRSLVSAYGRAPCWCDAATELERLFARRYDRVVDAAIASAELLLDAFGACPARIVRASSLETRGRKSELVLDLCRQLGATRYVSGRTGASYLDRAAFERAGIAIDVQQFTPMTYARTWPIAAGAARSLSAVDAWAHLGADVVQTWGSRKGAP